jgi:hypothetical protein
MARRPATPTTLQVVLPTRRRSFGSIVGGWAFRVARRLLVALTVATFLLALHGLLEFKRRWTGGQRHIFRPVALATLLWIPYDQAWQTYFVVAGLLGGLGAVRKLSKLAVRWASQRELRLLSIAFAALSTWHAVFNGIDGLWPTVTCLAVYATGATVVVVNWVRGREIRPTEEKTDELLQEWAEKVAVIPRLTPIDPLTGDYIEPEVPALNGRFTEWKSTGSGEGMGVLTLDRRRASEVVGLSEVVERALDLRRGSVRLMADPQLTVRQVQVVLVRDPDAAARRKVYWEGPTLAKDGRFVLARTPDGQPLYGRLRYPEMGSATHAGVVAPSMGGKGGAFRIIALEAALDPSTAVVSLDGKGGGGIPYLASSSSHHVSEKRLWLPTLRAFHAAMEVRSQLEGQRGHDGWVPTEEAPQMALFIDELPKVNGYLPGSRKSPGSVQIVNDISRTGRSLGYCVYATMQKGDEAGWGSTDTRNNVLGPAGWIWHGKTQDVQAKNTGMQGFQNTHGINPTLLPSGPGWAFVVGESLPGQPGMPARTLWVPTRSDVEKGHDAPFGTVEDWLERDAVQPAWHPLEREAFQETYDQLVGAEESSAAVLPPSALVPAQGNPNPFRRPDPAWGTAPVATVTDIDATPAGRQKVLAVLREAVEPLSAREVARRMDRHVSTVIEHLKKLAADEQAVETSDGWKAVA